MTTTPTGHQAMAWVAAYEAAWRSPGTATLADLFIEDATYQPAPFRDPWRGIGEISRMWEAERDGADEQFTLVAELVAASDGRAVVRAEVRYGPSPDHPDGGQLYRDLWVVHFAADGRCASFEEWPFWPPSTDGAVAGD